MDVLVAVVIAFLNLNLLNGAIQVESDICSPLNGRQLCYSLYGSSDASEIFTWDDAKTGCSALGKDLVRITSVSVQNIMLTQVLSSLSGGTIHVWTAGKKSNDGSLLTINGDPVDTSQFENMPGGDICGFIKDSGQTRPLSHTGCGGYNIEQVLCQSTTTGGPCTSPDVEYNGYCYNLYQDSRGLDWNSARQYCRNVQDRDLAYSGFTDPDFVSLFTNPFLNTWIGVTSRKWIWDMSNGPDVPMTYTKFRGGITDGKCVYIDPNDKGKWDAVPCSDLNSHYICEEERGESETTTTTTTPAPATRTPAPATRTPAPTQNPTQVPANQTPTPTPAPGVTTKTPTTPKPTSEVGPSTGNKSGLDQKYIIGIAVAGGVLLVVVIIAVAIVVTRGKRKTDDDDDTPAYNSHIETGSTMALNYGTGADVRNVYSESPGDGDTNVTSARPGEYAELDEDGGLVQGGPKGVPQGYKASPHGDLYSLPGPKIEQNGAKLGSIYENS